MEEILNIIPGPDFPTGGQLLGKKQCRDVYMAGRGILTMRALARIETDKRSNRASIIVSEIPYQVIKKNIVERIAELVNDKRIEGISDLRDESDRDGMRIVVELKRDAEPKIVLNQLYKHTQLQESYGLIMLSIHEGRPRELSLRDMLAEFLNHRRRVITRRTQFELRQAEARIHVLEGLAGRAAQPRRSHQADSRLERCGDGAQRPDDDLQAFADPGAGDPRHDSAPPDRVWSARRSRTSTRRLSRRSQRSRRSSPTRRS